MRRMSWLGLCVIATAIVALVLISRAPAARLPEKVRAGDPAWRIEKKQLKNLAYARRQLRPVTSGPEPAPAYRRWYRRAAAWIVREHRELEERTIAPWLPTKNCEAPGAGWWADTGNDYHGGLQFDHGTWKANGGLQFSYDADGATKIQQVTVASRLTYDGWPHCPNP